MWVLGFQLVCGCSSFGHSQVIHGIEHLSLQVAQAYGIGVYNANSPNSGGTEVLQEGGTQAACSYHQNAGTLEPFLCGETKPGKHSMAGIPQVFFLRKKRCVYWILFGWHGFAGFILLLPQEGGLACLPWSPWSGLLFVLCSNKSQVVHE